MHHHIAGKGYGEVVAQTLLADLRGQAQGVALGELLVGNLREVVARVQNLEEQLVTLLTILTHQRLKGLLGGRLNLLESVQLIDRTDGVEDIVALGHLYGAEVACSFGYTGFICHFLRLFVHDQDQY